MRYGTFRFGTGKPAAERNVERYPVGSVVEVFRSPGDPRTTILEPQASARTMHVTLGVAIGLVAFPFVYVPLYRRFRPRESGTTTTDT